MASKNVKTLAAAINSSPIFLWRPLLNPESSPPFSPESIVQVCIVPRVKDLRPD